MNTKKIIQIGNVYQTQFDNPTRGRVYSVKGLAPTINTCGGGGRKNMWVLIAEVYEEHDTYMRKRNSK